MSRVGKNDQRAIDRYIDGEMDAAERTRFESRLQRDEDLREAEAAARAGVTARREAAPPPLRAPATFAMQVLDRVRQLPSRQELVQITETEAVYAANLEMAVVYARRLLVAAVVLAGLSLLFCLGLLRRDAEGLSAKPDDDRRLMEQLDTRAKEILADRLRRR